MASQIVLVVKNPPTNTGDTRDMGLVSLGREEPLEKGMATHSSILTWEIPWTEEPGGYSPWSHKESEANEQLSTLFVYLYKVLIVVNIEWVFMIYQHIQAIGSKHSTYINVSIPHSISIITLMLLMRKQQLREVI